MLAALPAAYFLPVVYAARSEDREWFRQAVLAYVGDAGGDLLACPENVDLFAALFDLYVEGQGGVVLLVRAAASSPSPVGFTMAGELPMGFRTRHGRAAMGWGTYVQPSSRRRGLARLLRRALDRRLREMGFDAILGGYAPENAPAEASLRGTGFQVYQVLGAKRLKE